MHEDNNDEGKLATVEEEVEDMQDKVCLDIDIPEQAHFLFKSTSSYFPK
jgi:hypothetical protein